MCEGKELSEVGGVKGVQIDVCVFLSYLFFQCFCEEEIGINYISLFVFIILINLRVSLKIFCYKNILVYFLIFGFLGLFLYW